MFPRRLFLCLAAAIMAPNFSRADFAARSVPKMTAADLNGRALTLPDDMVGDPAVWVVAFDRAHQSQVDRLFGLVQQAMVASPNVVTWEVPVIENPGAIGRWFIDNGMRSGIPKKETRAKVVTLYVPDRATWLREMGIASVDQAYAVLINRNGKIEAVAAQSDIKSADDMKAFVSRPLKPAATP